MKLYAKVARIVATGEGNGPVHALDTGLWLAQLPRPVKSSDGEGEWDTIGVPEMWLPPRGTLWSTRSATAC